MVASKTENILVERLKNNKGKRCEIWLDNGFVHSGIISNCDDSYLELIVQKGHISYIKLIRPKDVKDANIYGEISTGNGGVK